MLRQSKQPVARAQCCSPLRALTTLFPSSPLATNGRLAPRTACEDLYRVVCEVHEGLDNLPAAEYPSYLGLFVRPLLGLLSRIEPQFADKPEHRLRNKVLEVLNRCPKTEAFAPYAAEMFGALLGVVKADNQDNAIIAFKNFVELARLYKGLLEEQAKELFAFIIEVRVCVRGCVCSIIRDEGGCLPLS